MDLAIVSALFDPLAKSIIFRASRMVPIPMVIASVGTSSFRSKNLALSEIVFSVSLTFRVRDASEDPGSLKPICPLVPIPSTW